MKHHYLTVVVFSLFLLSQVGLANTIYTVVPNNDTFKGYLLESSGNFFSTLEIGAEFTPQQYNDTGTSNDVFAVVSGGGGAVNTWNRFNLTPSARSNSCRYSVVEIYMGRT